MCLRNAQKPIMTQSSIASIPARADTAIVAAETSGGMLSLELDDIADCCPVVLVVVALAEAGEVYDECVVIPGGVQVAEYMLMNEKPPQASLLFPEHC